MGRGCLYFVLGVPVAIIAIVLASNASHTGGPPPPSGPSFSEMRDATLNYRACDGGMTVEQATVVSIRATGAQSIGSARYAGDEGKDNTKVAVEYKAANGSQKQITFGYHPSTGKVGAEDNDSLAILRMMEAGCRK